jgi:polyisoprenoid-binding protein YceI
MALSGTFNADPVHSSITWSVLHGGIAPFKSGFDGFEGRLDADAGTLEGKVKVEDISIKLPPFRGHLMGDDFFDAENHPEITFSSSKVDLADGGTATIEGDLTIRDTTKPITATGTWTGPNPDGKIAIQAGTTIDRKAYGIKWEAPILSNGVASLADDVTVEFVVQFAPAE